MGLLQKAVETYDAHSFLVGKYIEGKQPLAPIGHIITSADLEINIDIDGNFLAAQAVGKNEGKIIIPVTEESSGRTRAPCAHPLCDQLVYIAPYNEEKHTLYIDQLRKWSSSDNLHPFLQPVLRYVENGTILDDLLRCGLIKTDQKGIPDNEKLFIRWRIVGVTEGDSACWTNKELFDAFVRFYGTQKETNDKNFCMVSGLMGVTAQQHPKGIIPISGNAKLISANDTTGFTYRGRFTEDWQAATVGYEASQKAHNALRWLAANESVSVIYGGRTFLCWNPKGIEIPRVHIPFLKNKDPASAKIKPSEYREELKKALYGYRAKLPESEGVVIAAFDAATTGRLALAYYNELRGSDFLQRLYEWELHCCWNNGAYGIQSPTLFQIVNCAYGMQRNEKNGSRLETDDALLKQQIQGLISCRVDKAYIAINLVKMLVDRASSPQRFDEKIWKGIVFTACAVLNKHRFDTKGEDMMSWELDKKDRSFQFGRLLAVMERLEADYYGRTGEERQTNAIKAMSAFRLRPYHTYEQINRHLMQAYAPRVKPWQRARYERLKQEIMEILREFPEEGINRPLEDIYLMGYDCQKNQFFKKQENEQTIEEEE